MAFRILSQMEETRKKKENYLNGKGTYYTLIILGCFTILICIFFILLGLPSDGGGAETTTTEVDYADVCFSILGLIGVIGLIMLIVGNSRRAMFNRGLTSKEAEYQQFHSRLISFLDASPIPQDIRMGYPPLSIAPLITPAPLIQEGRKSTKRIWLIAAIAGVVLIFLCAIVVIFILMGMPGSIKLEEAPINTVLDKFMQTMVAGDIENTYLLFSPHVQEQMSPADLDNLIQLGDNVLFEGYQSIAATNITLNSGVNPNPDMPQGKVAEVTGAIYYADGSVGDFSAVLEKVDGQWMLYNINLKVPAEKFQP